MLRPFRALAVALLTVGALLTAGVTPGAAADTGLLRVAHLSPDTPAVDLAVDPLGRPGTGTTARGIGYGDVSDHQELPAGTYTVSVRTAGGDPARPPVLSTTVEVPAGGARTVAAMGGFADLRLAVLDADLSTPPAGSARVRVVDAAATAPSVDVTTADGSALATGLTSGTAGPPATVPGGPASLQVTVGSTTTDVPADLAAGSVYTVLVLDRPDGGLEVRTVLDAAGAAVVPTGGVETGAGGAAGPAPAAVVLAAGAVLGAVALLWPRARRR
ncbi:DUF4397 domain-containing protein [Geodermatophilus sp. SYSU D00703]